MYFSTIVFVRISTQLLNLFDFHIVQNQGKHCNFSVLNWPNMQVVDSLFEKLK